MRRALFLILLVLLPAEAGAIDLFNIRNSLIQFALEQISTEDFTITAEDVESPGDGVTELVGVTIADRDGVWFEAERMGLQWNARRILSAELEINRLSAVGVRVLRRPQGSVEVKEDAAIAEEDGEPFDWPRAPIATRVERLELTRVFLAEGVIAAQSLAFDATGSARDEGEIQAVALSLARTDTVAGRIALDYERDFAANTLRANLEAEEAAGGLVAELAGLPEDSASRVRLMADGPLTQWGMEVSAETERVFTASGAATVDLEGPLAIRAGFEVAPGPALSEAVATVLGEAARLDIDVVEDAAGVIDIRRAALVSPALTLDADGAYDRATGRADLEVVLDGRSALAGLAEGVDFEGFGFDGRVAGTLEDLAATGALRLAGLTTAPADVGAARLAAEVTRQGARLGFSLSGGAEGLRIDRLGPDLLGAAEILATGAYEGAEVTLEGLRIAAVPLTVEAEGAVDLEAEAARLAYALTTPDLAPLAAAYGVEAAGRAQVSGRAEGPFAAIALEGEAALRDLAFEGESYGEVALRHNITAGERIDGRLSLRAAGSPAGPVTADVDLALAGERLDLSRIEATALGAELAGALVYGLDTGLADGEVRLDAPDIAAASELAGAPLSGQVDGRVALSGAEGLQAATLDLALANIAGFGARLGSGRLEADVADVATLAGAEAQLRARDAEAEGLRLVRLALDAEMEGPDAVLDLSVEGVTGDGIRIPSARLEARAAEALGALPEVTARLRAPRLTAGEANAEDLRLDLRADTPLTEPRLDLALATGPLRAGPSELSGLRATLRGALDALTARLATEGEAMGKPVTLEADAAIDAAAPAPLARITRLDAALGEDRIALAAPLTLRAGASTELTGLDLSLPEGRLRGDAALHPNGLSAEFRLELGNLAIAERLADLPISGGRLAADIALDTRPGRATGDLALEVSELRFASALADAALGLGAAGQWDGRRATLEAALSGPFAQPLSMEGGVDLRPSGGLLPTVPRGGDLAADISWDGDIGELWALVPAPGHVLDGRLALDLGLDGPVAEPALSGQVSLADGRYENLDLGTILTDLALGSEILARDRLRLELTARDGAAGRVEAEAEVTAETVAAELRARSAVLVRRDDATAAVSLDIAAEGPLAGPDISGTVTIDRAEIRLVNATPPSVVTLGDVRIKGAPEEPEAEPAGAAVGLDVAVRGPGNIFVRGRGLNSEWRIGLAITGTAAAPRIAGSVERVRGHLDLIGTRFDLETGLVTFLGGPEINPRLDVRLEADANDVTGGIRVEGSANSPEIGFYSRQGLPEDEVLPRLLFGKPSQSLTASQALRLASGLATLLDGSGGVVDTVRGAVGLDFLSVDPTEDGADVSVGKNISDDVFVGASQSVDGSESKVTVEIEVFEGVVVDSEINQEGSASVGVRWKTDF